MSKINEVFKYPTFTYRKFNFFCVNIMRKNVKNNHKKSWLKNQLSKKSSNFNYLPNLVLSIAVVVEPGRSMGDPMTLSQIRLVKVPRARLTPNKTV